jgi:aspartyl protease family protein
VIEPLVRWLVAALLVLTGIAASAQTVSLSGSMGDKALLVINGTPRTVAVGTTRDGVKVIGVTPHEATVEIDGKRIVLALGGAQVNLGGAGGESSGTRIVMTAGSGGHFLSDGSINGRQVRFLVDTGASVIALGRTDAERIGLDYKNAPRVRMNTANGQVVAFRVMLSTVRIGDVQVHNVEAIVNPGEMPYVLLGNSFLTRFQMKRENDMLTLERRL